MSQPINGRVARLRALLVSSAVAALGVAAPALAATDRPFGVAEAYAAGSIAPDLIYEREAQAEFRAVPIRDEMVFEREPQIVIANPGTPTTARDPKDVTGIAQMVVDSGGGSIGLCTGSLINPRTVLFAAHCVNSRPATAYGKNSGGVGIGFGFSNSNLPQIRQWLLPTITGGLPNPDQFKTNIAGAFFNVNQVFYNPVSLEPESRTFLYADVATATLDMPAAGIPTWALLFSALPATTITQNGTGYHVELQGYGRNGNATTGSSGAIDFRRRIAENMIGGLTDLRTFETFLFGSSTSPTQNLYFIDFDDPRRGLTGASPFDFNAFRDNAAGPNEGNTAGGDSGGPLIVDRAFAKPVIAGVLSGGYTRFFNGQPDNGYGTVAFYQPLFLYWDYIAANNPYRYVTAAAGDGRWADPTRWRTTLDPNYNIIGPNGQLVNGIPNDLGLGKNGTTGDFGEICFQDATSSECLNTATGITRNEMKPIGTGAAEDNAGKVQVAAISDNAAQVSGIVSRETVSAMGGPVAQAEGTQSGLALPAATIANGLPGATNFVPNNADGDRTLGTIGRYFDVTLGAAGTTTLDTSVTIDRFTLANAGARLNIASNGSLTSLIDVTQIAGVTQVDGTLNSRGDFLVMGGGLTGSGRINAPFTTNVAGAIAPGTNGTIGTLTFGGNLVLASASSLVIDLGANQTSDRVAVVGTVFNGTIPANGIANVGGRVAFGLVPGAIVRANDVFTILTAQGAVTGQFATPSSISAILTPQFIYTSNQVQARLIAGSFRTVVGSQGSQVQSSFAQLLDQNRGQPQFAGLFDVLDLQSAATIQGTLEALAPRTETLKTAVGVAAVDNISRMFRERLSNLEVGELGGTIALIGRPAQTAALAFSAIPGQQGIMNDATAGGVEVQENRLPETMSAFLAGGYLDGNSAPMANARPTGGRDQFDGFYLAAGIETEIDESAVFGFAMSYTELEGETTVAGQTADSKLVQGTIYGKTSMGPAYLDVQGSAGWLSSRTSRSAAIVANSFNLRGRDDALTFSAEVGAGAMFGEAIQFGPRIAARTSYIGFSRFNERGGGPALTIDRDNLRSLQGRAGLVVKSTGTIRPFANATYVHDFEDQPAAFGANFVGGVGPNAFFALAGQDQDWFEVGGGLAIDTGPVELSVSADTTFERDDVENQSYRASVKFKF